MNFSVLMSVYKSDNPSFFEEALNSVSTIQTVKPKQIVIVKDGPVDEKIDLIIKKIENRNKNIEFTIISNKENKGLASALNDGIKSCKYEWIARMDADDISLSNRFEKQIHYLLNNPDVDVLGGCIAEFNNVPGDLKSKRIVASNSEEIRKMAKKRTPMNHMTVMYRKKAVEDVGCYSVSFGKLEDYKLWVDLINANYKLNNLEDIVLNARVGNGFLSRRSNKREIKDWDMLQKYLLEHHIVNKFEAIINRLNIRVFIYMPCWIKKIIYKVLLRNK